jgi:flagellar motor switch protein FliG
MSSPRLDSGAPAATIAAEEPSAAGGASPAAPAKGPAETAEDRASPHKEMSGLEKAAAMLVLLGDDYASRVYRLLEDDEIQAISRAISHLRPLSPDLAGDLMEEFFHMILARDYMARGGSNYAKRLLLKSVGPERSRKIIDQLTRPASSPDLFSNAQATPPPQLARLLGAEHPQTIALVLAHLTPENAAAVMSHLPEETRVKITMRLANLGEVYPDAVQEVSRLLDDRLAGLNESSVGHYGGVRSVAECLNRMERGQSKAVLEQIEEEDPALANAIRNLMVVFDDLMLVSDRQMMEVLKRVDRNLLAAALKGTSSELKNKFFSNMSSRAAAMLQQEMEFMGPIKLKDVERAQSEIVAVVRQMEDEGVIDFGRGSSDELVL